MSDEATAFVPGHVTGFFTVERDDDDPTKTGSRGAGLAIEEGVTVSVRPADQVEVYFEDATIELEAVERVLVALEANARVRIETDLPLGAGFGVSGAAALGTALATNRAFDRRLSENELVTIAHGAEVQAGTGLGDVVAQARGGVPVRLDPGAPEHNNVDGIPGGARVEFVSFGDLGTAEVIEGDTEVVTEVGRRALSRVVGEPTLTSFIYASRRFAREAELLTPRVEEAVDAVSEADGEASMAMLGDTVFALGTGLTDAGYDPVVTRTHAAGAVVE
jgi:pantoate kinase